MTCGPRYKNAVSHSLACLKVLHSKLSNHDHHSTPGHTHIPVSGHSSVSAHHTTPSHNQQVSRPSAIHNSQQNVLSQLCIVLSIPTTLHPFRLTLRPHLIYLQHLLPQTNPSLEMSRQKHQKLPHLIPM